MNMRAGKSPLGAPLRMGKLARLPVFFALAGKRVAVAGGTPPAAWKAELLSACGARVDIYAGDPCEELLALAEAPPDGVITITQRDWTVGDLHDAAIAIGAFDNDDAAATFAASARAAGVPVNVIDKPAYCDFSFGSIVNRSPLVIGISTGAAAPVLAQAIRMRIETLLPQGFALWAAAAARWRARLKATSLSFAGRRRFWRLFAARALENPDRVPAESDFAQFVHAVEALGAAVDAGTVTTVDCGPGDPELLTLRTARALQSADVIMFDETVPPAMLDFARREASKIVVRAGDDPEAAMAAMAALGRRVVRLRHTALVN